MANSPVVASEADIACSQRTRWSSREVPDRERFDAWQAALNELHLRWSLSKNERAQFDASLEAVPLQDLRLILCESQPCSGLRSKPEIAATDAESFGILVVFEGQEEVEVTHRRHGSTSAVVRPGNVLLWDSTAPIRFKLQSPIRKLTLLVPQERMRDVFPSARRLLGRAVDWSTGLGAVTTAHLAALGAQASHLNGSSSRCAAEVALELIAASFAKEVSATDQCFHPGLLEKIQQYIDDNLGDPSLGPGSLAEHFGVSLRYLHLLFSREELTVARWIQLRRLERCRRELVLAGSHRNISELAFAVGFTDASHFSRAFRARYGVSPRQYRRQHEDPQGRCVAGTPGEAIRRAH